MDWTGTAIHDLLLNLAVMAFDPEDKMFPDQDKPPEFRFENVGYRLAGFRSDGGVPSLPRYQPLIIIAEALVRFHLHCVATYPTSGPSEVDVAAHVFVQTVKPRLPGAPSRAAEDMQSTPSLAENPEITQSKVIIDTRMLRVAAERHLAGERGQYQPIRAMDRDEKYGSMPGKVSHRVLEEKYMMYVAAINNDTLPQSLSEHCHDPIIIDCNEYPLNELQKKMEDRDSVIETRHVHVAKTFVNARHQCVAAMIDVRIVEVTPQETVSGIINFSAIGFCWFKDGKIAETIMMRDAFQNY